MPRCAVVLSLINVVDAGYLIAGDTNVPEIRNPSVVPCLVGVVGFDIYVEVVGVPISALDIVTPLEARLKVVVLSPTLSSWIRKVTERGILEDTQPKACEVRPERTQ